MADERNRWLDEAAAERVLRGSPAAPGADRHAREAEARLRAALDMLAEPQPRAGVELPGEAAAVAAFRAARGEAATAGASGVSAPVGADTVSPVALGTVIPLTAPASASVPAARRGHPVRFGLVAALAGVAVGGLAVAAGVGLLDRATHDTAGPAPVVSLSADENPTTAGDTAGPTLAPQLRPTPLRGADGSVPTPGGTQTPGADSGAPQGYGTGTETGPGTSSGSSAGKDGKETFAGGSTALKDTDKQRLKAVDLCEAYRSGHMTADRRDRLSKLAQGLGRIPHFCEALLDGPGGADTPSVPRTTDDGGAVLKAPTLTPASPGASAPVRLPR